MTITSTRTMLCIALGILLTASSSDRGLGAVQPSGKAAADGTLSVLTYNVKGLPWPVAWRRSSALRTIASRLVELRLQGKAPHVVVLQEAFTEDAQAIGRNAGYRYVVNGPSPGDEDVAPMSGGDRLFAAGASWWKGETEGKLVGSGLLLMSDFPIIAVRRMAYPAFACAGYDCLANKGALLVTMRVPGSPSLVDIVTTHLNSRHASGVSDERSLYAYARQGSALSAFIDEWHEPSRPLIVAGDFNVGSAVPRWSALRAQIAGWSGRGKVRSALHEAAAPRFAETGGVPKDAFTALHRARDWQFFASGRETRLRMVGVRVPFGHEPGGGMLSDHIGYTSVFRLEEI